jgi:hypothetical protein
LRKFFLLVFSFLLIFTQPVLAGVGILQAAKQAGLELECPDGAANCVEEEAAVEGAEATKASDYSLAGAQKFILKLLSGLLGFAALIAVLMLIVVALRLVTARGSQDALAAAKKQILWVFGGLFIIILSLLIVKNITEKVYEIAHECPSIAVDGLFGP